MSLIANSLDDTTKDQVGRVRAGDGLELGKLETSFRDMVFQGRLYFFLYLLAFLFFYFVASATLYSYSPNASLTHVFFGPVQIIGLLVIATSLYITSVFWVIRSREVVMRYVDILSNHYRKDPSPGIVVLVNEDSLAATLFIHLYHISNYYKNLYFVSSVVLFPTLYAMLVYASSSPNFSNFFYLSLPLVVLTVSISLYYAQNASDTVTRLTGASFLGYQMSFMLANLRRALFPPSSNFGAGSEESEEDEGHSSFGGGGVNPVA